MINATKAFIIGYPVTHSKSPAIHRYWLGYHGLEGQYTPCEVKPGGLKHFIDKYVRQGQYIGGNVTMPYKQDIMDMVDKLEENACAIGAVNTLWFEGDTLVGGNTDAFGFSRNIELAAPEMVRKKAMVLGAGGAARAIVYALIQMGFHHLYLCNRSIEKAQSLSQHFTSSPVSINVVPWSQRNDVLPHQDLLVNSTSLGMVGHPEIDICLDRLPKHAVVSDIVYHPLETKLLAAARYRGLTAVDGLGMLLHQAVPGFARWFGVKPMVDDELRRIVLS